MLTVTLVATFAAAALWQQWRAVEVEAAERARVQSGWVLIGALDWSRLILREDARAGGGTGGADHLAEPWAVPLEEAKLTSFLAADKNIASDALEGLPDAFLSGRIIDAQSKLNVLNLVESGKPATASVAAFTKLFELLGLPAQELAVLTVNLQQALPPAAAPPAGRHRHRHRHGHGTGTARARHRHDATAGDRRHVGDRPADAAAHLAAGLARPLAHDRGGARALCHRAAGAHAAQHQHRQRRSPLRQRALARPGRRQAPGGAAHAQPLPQPRRCRHAARSRTARRSSAKASTAWRRSFFEVHGRLRLDRTWVEEQSLLRRDGIEVRIVWRERGAGATIGAAETLKRKLLRHAYRIKSTRAPVPRATDAIKFVASDVNHPPTMTTLYRHRHGPAARHRPSPARPRRRRVRLGASGPATAASCAPRAARRRRCCRASDEVILGVPAAALSWHQVTLAPGQHERRRAPALGARRPARRPPARRPRDPAFRAGARRHAPARPYGWRPATASGCAAPCRRSKAAGRRVTRIVPEFAPQPAGAPPHGLRDRRAGRRAARGLRHATAWPCCRSTAPALALAGNAARRHRRCWPSPRWPNWPKACSDAACRSSSRPHAGCRPARSPWDLAQFDLASTGRARAEQEARRDLAQRCGTGPQWRAARWGARGAGAGATHRPQCLGLEGAQRTRSQAQRGAAAS